MGYDVPGRKFDSDRKLSVENELGVKWNDP
jgi:hypothetical protein